GHDLRRRVRNLDADGAAAGDWCDNANRRRPHREREITGQICDLTHFHAWRGLDLVLSDDRAGRTANELAFDTERAQCIHELRAHRVELATADVGVAWLRWREQIARRQLVADYGDWMRARLDRCVDLDLTLGGKIRTALLARRLPSAPASAPSLSSKRNDTPPPTRPGSSSGAGSRPAAFAATSAPTSLSSFLRRRFGGVRGSASGSGRSLGARCPMRTRIGFQARVVAVRVLNARA